MNYKKIQDKLEDFYCVPIDFGPHEICNLRERIKWVPKEDRGSEYRALNKMEWNYAFDESVPHVKFESFKRKNVVHGDIHMGKLERAKKAIAKKKRKND